MSIEYSIRDYGAKEALERYYSEMAEDDIVKASLLQIKIAELALAARMLELHNARPKQDD